MNHEMNGNIKTMSGSVNSILALLSAASLLIGCQGMQNNKDNTANTVPAQVSIGLYHDAVADATRELIAATPPKDRAKLIFPFDSRERVYGTDTKNTDSFCAVLAWCEAWGIKQGDMDATQLSALHKLLSTALSPGGYQVFLAVMNRHRVIGEIEDVASSAFIESVEKHCPDVVAASIFELADKCPQAALGDYNTVAGALSPVDGKYDLRWTWKKAPGLDIRRKQFDQFSIALFGEVEGDDWAIRVEGHHATLNIHFQRDRESGEIAVFNSPLFFGSFPVIVPTDPHDAQDTSTQWKWTKGQVLMYSAIDNLREYWLALPKAMRQSAFIDDENFQQEGPVLVTTFPPWLLSSLDPKVDNSKIERFPHVRTTSDSLPLEAVWRLRQAFGFYFGAMNRDVASQYEQRLTESLRGGAPVTIAWAGGDLTDKGGNHFSYIRIGDLLLEFQQSNQWSTQHDPDVRGNHVHSVLRDLSYPWDFDPAKKHLSDKHGHLHNQ